MGDFTKLNVWMKSKDLSITLYKITSHGEFAKDFGLKDQIRRAAVSIPSNIAEGEESGTNPQSIRFLNITKGSAAELRTQLVIAHEIGYLNNQIHLELMN